MYWILIAFCYDCIPIAKTLLLFILVQKCYLSYTGRNGKASSTKQGRGWTMEGIQAFNSNLIRVKKERRQLGDDFEKTFLKHCKKMSKKRGNTKRAPKAVKTEVVELDCKDLSLSVHAVNSASEISSDEGGDEAGKSSKKKSGEKKGKEKEVAYGDMFSDEHQNSNGKQASPKRSLRKKRKRITSCKI